jgi:glycosyltransferase involved in cell wall biosynthesis
MTHGQTGKTDPQKKRILIFCDYYLPSRSGGGGLRTVVNLVERFANRYQFFVVTRNHDNRVDSTPFAEISADNWNSVGNAQVMYFAPSDITSAKVASIVREIGPSGVYLNSLFSKPVVKFLLARSRMLFPDVPVVLAPCGEVAASALRSKRWKKRVFLAFARFIGLYSRVVWKASSDVEKEQIRALLGLSLEPFVAADMPPRDILRDFEQAQKPAKCSGTATFTFLSRIDSIKNLDFLIDRIANIKDGEARLNIVGPIEDERYWSECRKKIDSLPGNIRVKVVGGVSYDDGLEILMDSHFLVLPTKGENFGYVLLEALAAGCPIVVSNQTIWNRVESENGGWVIALDDKKRWESVLAECVSIDQTHFSDMSRRARSIAIEWLTDPKNESATEKVLVSAFGE